MMYQDPHWLNQPGNRPDKNPHERYMPIRDVPHHWDAWLMQSGSWQCLDSRICDWERVLLHLSPLPHQTIGRN